MGLGVSIVWLGYGVQFISRLHEIISGQLLSGVQTASCTIDDNNVILLNAHSISQLTCTLYILVRSSEEYERYLDCRYIHSGGVQLVLGVVSFLEFIV